MNTSRKKQVGLLLVLVVIAGLFAFVQSSAADEPVLERQHGKPVLTPWVRGKGIRVLPPTRRWYGRTYEEWAAEWWQWAAELPADENHPFLADGEVDCSLGQQGHVWFLGGTYAESGEADRQCAIPAHKALFFPIVNVLCSPFTGDDPAALLACAENPPVPEGFEFQMNPLSARIDGKKIGNMKKFYTLSEETFVLGPLPGPLPEDNIFYNPDHPEWGAVPGAEAPGATSGYFLLLPPLYPGEHTISFSGEILVLDPDKVPVYEFKLDISYKLEVED